MRDTITEEDLLVDITKTEIEKQFVKSENEKDILKERVQALENNMRALVKVVQESILKSQSIMVIEEA